MKQSTQTATPPEADSSHISRIDQQSLMTTEFNREVIVHAILELGRKKITIQDVSNEQFAEILASAIEKATDTHNPDYELDPRKDIGHYLGTLEPEHQTDVRFTARNFPMEAECKLSIVIPVASLQEGQSIYRTLDSFSQQSSDPRTFEIVLFENVMYGSDLPYDYTWEEIDRFKADNPYINVAHVFGGIEKENLAIGYIRKWATDFTLQRYFNRGIYDRDHYIVRTDADTYGVHKDFVQNYISKFEENPNVDAFRGSLDFALEHFASDPLLYFGHRVFTLLSSSIRIKDPNALQSGGANTAFRASAYAKVGGFKASTTIAEDVDFDRRLQLYRKGSSHHKAIEFAGSKSRLFSSARRGAAALSHGFAPVEQWSIKETGFSGENKDIRSLSIEPDRKNFLKILARPDLNQRLQRIANRTFAAYAPRSFDENSLIAQNMLSVLAHLGVTATFGSQSEIQVSDSRKFVNKMLHFIDSWPKIRARITGQ